jgi:hypothetical protein
MWRRPSKRQIRRVTLALLLPALMFRAAIPAGFMPSVDATGQLALVMCSGAVFVPVWSGVEPAYVQTAPGKYGATAVPLTLALGKHSPARSEGDTTPCVFSAVAGWAPLPDSVTVRRLEVTTDLWRCRDAVEFICPNILRTQSARAPPHPRNA